MKLFPNFTRYLIAYLYHGRRIAFAIMGFDLFIPHGFIVSIENSTLSRIDLSSKFSECFDKIPLRILHDVLFRVFRFSKASFNALTSQFIEF